MDKNAFKLTAKLDGKPIEVYSADFNSDGMLNVVWYMNDKRNQRWVFAKNAALEITIVNVISI